MVRCGLRKWKLHFIQCNLLDNEFHKFTTLFVKQGMSFFPASSIMISHETIKSRKKIIPLLALFSHEGKIFFKGSSTQTALKSHEPEVGHMASYS